MLCATLSEVWDTNSFNLLGCASSAKFLVPNTSSTVSDL
jgi:hypothetical protein